MTDWTAIATIALAIATFALVVQTWWHRRAGERASIARLIRAAVREQLSNLDAWTAHDPHQGDVLRLVQLAELQPSLDRVTSVLEGVDLSDELAVYLVWLLGDLDRALGDLRRAVAPYVNLQNARFTQAPQAVTASWRVCLEHLQVLLCLIQAEARRRDMEELADLGAGVAWAQPVMRPGEMRAGDRVIEVTRLHAPPFPSDPAYARCDIGPREAEARRLSAAREAAMVAAVSPHPDI